MNQSNTTDLAERLRRVVIHGQHPLSVNPISFDLARDLMEASSILMEIGEKKPESDDEVNVI